MKKKIYIISSLIIIILFAILCVKSNAANKINLISEKNTVEKNEEFTVTAEIDKTNVAAFTIWMYFDNELVQCTKETSKTNESDSSNNFNIVGNKIVYTWTSETGKNKALSELAEFNFKAIGSGEAIFAIIGEFYSENGEKAEITSGNLSIKIGNNDLGEMIEAEKEETKENEEQGFKEQITDEEQKNAEEKSNQESSNPSNANLNIMRTGQEGITPSFSPEIQEYYLVIDENVQNINVTAIPENRNAKVKISGNKSLKLGKNTVNIQVVSEDESNKKEYIIYVTKTNDYEKANTNLETLAIENYTLNPEFSNNVTEYKIEVSNSIDNLNILAIPEDMGAKVSVNGNKELKEGNNQVVITIVAADGITEKQYKIGVYKRNLNEEEKYEKEQQEIINEANNINKTNNTEDSSIDNTENTSDTNQNNIEQDNSKKENNIENIILGIIGTVLALIVFGIVIIRIWKKK